VKMGKEKCRKIDLIYYMTKKLYYSSYDFNPLTQFTIYDSRTTLFIDLKILELHDNFLNEYARSHTHKK
jgi:hypothetical protein